MAANDSIGRILYNGIFRRNSVFIGTIFASAFVFEVVYDRTTQSIFDSINRGKQWKDIRDKYIAAGTTKEDDDSDE